MIQTFAPIQRKLCAEHYLDIAKMLAYWCKINGARHHRINAESMLHLLTGAGMSNVEHTMDMLLGPECEMDGRKGPRNNTRTTKAAQVGS